MMNLPEMMDAEFERVRGIISDAYKIPLNPETTRVMRLIFFSGIGAYAQMVDAFNATEPTAVEARIMATLVTQKLLSEMKGVGDSSATSNPIPLETNYNEDNWDGTKAFGA